MKGQGQTIFRRERSVFQQSLSDCQMNKTVQKESLSVKGKIKSCIQEKGGRNPEVRLLFLLGGARLYSPEGGEPSRNPFGDHVIAEKYARMVSRNRRFGYSSKKALPHSLKSSSWGRKNAELKKRREAQSQRG